MVGELYKAFRSGGAGSQESPKQAYVQCQCGEDHPGRPQDADSRGCGSGGMVLGPGAEGQLS